MIPKDYEPLEVIILKKRLANLTCKCSVCEKNSDSFMYPEDYTQNDKEIQASSFSDQSGNFILGKNGNIFESKVENLCNNVSCPGCYIAINLLKARETKVCKDEETETKAGLSYCHKSTGKCVKFLEKTTSTSSMMKPYEGSKISVCGKMTNINTLNGIMKKRSNEHVTFSDHQHKDSTSMQNNELQAFYGHCFCLENFMDSIRPPLSNK